jgi:probable HAF family extracellular repeat protein
VALAARACASIEEASMKTKKMLLISLCLPLTALAAPPQFTVTDLGPANRPGEGLLWHGIQGQTENYLPSLGGTPVSNVVYEMIGQSAVGSSEVDPNGRQFHAALWPSSGSVIDLGVLPGAVGDVTDDGPQSIAYGFNSVGDVVGISQTAFAPADSSDAYRVWHAFLWNNGAMRDLGTLAIPNSDPNISQGYTSDNYASQAEGVNGFHEVVGMSQAISSADNSVLWRAFYYADGTMYNLSFLLSGAPSSLRLTEAMGIDCQGNISAVGVDLNTNAVHSYLLTRVGSARNCAP